MVDKTFGTDCGGFTYTLEYLSGPLKDDSEPQGADLSFYTDIGRTITGTMGYIQMVGAHEMRLKCTLGDSNNNAMKDRGRDGLFESVYSDNITVTVINPCETSIVSSMRVQSMTMPKGQTLLTAEYGGPSDSASLLYGNGYDKCGPIKYMITDPQGFEFSRPWLQFEYDTEVNAQDAVFINVISEPDGALYVFDLLFKAELERYPSSEAYVAQFSIAIRGCFFEKFTARRIP